MQLFPYQQQAIDFITERKRVYLALDMGLGKTLTSLVSAHQNGTKNIMLVAEKNEIVNSENFKREVITHFPDLQYVSLRDFDLGFIRGSNTRTVCGINPESLTKHSVATLKGLFDVTLIDEATLAKNTATDRFRAIKKVCESMDYVVLLSGTPMLNGASELYAPMMLLKNPMVYGKKVEAKKAFEKIFAGGGYKQIKSTKGYTDKFVGTHLYMFYSWWAKGANNLRVLRWLLRDQFYFLRKADTGGVFKTKHRTIRWVEMGFVWLAEYVKAWDEYYLEAGTRKVDLDNIKDLRNLIEKGQMYQVNSRWKSETVVEDIASGKWDGRRIVVFSMFQETDELIQDLLKKKGIAFRTFDELSEWKSGSEQVLVGRIKAHGKGGNVPEASVVLFVDMDYVPANNIQAENRVDRPAQTRDMDIIYYLTTGEDVVDAHIRKINQDKMKRIEEFMRPLTAEEMEDMPRLVEELKAKFPKETQILGI